MNLTASDQVYRGIRRMLSKGQLTPGQQVSQSRIAQQMGFSTLPVVEAMRRLESEGLFVKQPHKMARVRKLSAVDLKGLYLLREGIEAATSRLCVEQITDEQARELQELEETYEQVWETYERAGEKDLERETDIAIHRHIAECARCPILSTELDRLTLLEQTAARAPMREGLRFGHPHSHRALVQAIVDRDSDSAEYLMRKHIQRGYQESIREFDAEGAKG